LLEVDGFGLLLDAGLGPRQLAARLASVGASWKRVHAVLLTHTHTDHWKDRTLQQLHRLRIPLYCQADHHPDLLAYGSAFAARRRDGRVRPYLPEEELTLAPGLRCLPLRLRHDGAGTCGFRFEAAADMFGRPCALAYAADLGSWHDELARALAGVD